METSKANSLYSLAFFRFAFGLLMAAAILRFYLKGWIEDFYLKPSYFFSYYGFGWATPPSYPPLVYGVYAALFLSALLIMVGLWFRPAIISFFILFTYAELWDKAVYLNHYYLISLLSFLMAFLPMNAIASVDAWRRNEPIRIPDFGIPPELLLKIQVGTVYFFGGVAKIGYDWLILGQPLKIWLAANDHLPLVGPLLSYPEVAIAVSWIGFLFDISAPILLYFDRTRPWIYPVVIIFHVLTAILFPIGMFPWFMCVFALIFFPSAWHRGVMEKIFRNRRFHELEMLTPGLSPLPVVKGTLTVFFLLQLLMPFRAWLYSGNPLWHEQGFRFSWRIMLMEKNGTVDYIVRVKETGKEFIVRPSKYLSPRQVAQMSFQPDMILQFAHYLHQVFLKNGTGDTEVRAHSYASLNGKGSMILIDPDVDLAAQKQGWAPKTYITAGPK